MVLWLLLCDDSAGLSRRYGGGQLLIKYDDHLTDPKYVTSAVLRACRVETISESLSIRRRMYVIFHSRREAGEAAKMS